MTAGLLDLLEEAAGGPATLRFLPDAPDPVPLADLWREAGTCARWLDAHVDRDGAVGAVLTSSFACAATLLGVWRSGRTLVSLPAPGRGMDLDEYRALLGRLCAAAGAERLGLDARYVALLEPSPVPVVAFEDLRAGGPGPVPDEPGRLIQFTSGTTAQPKGVVLGLDAVAANVLAILEALAPGPGEVACSWLPLSHDMGLIGMFLSPLVAASPRVAGGVELVLIDPEAFIRRPRLWLDALARYRGTFTAAPNFALELARRSLARSPADLGRLRVCIVGAEPVRAETLDAFVAAGAPGGLRRAALCPAYGLAEAALAVCVTRPGEEWHATEVDPVALGTGEWRPAPGGTGVVACGRPIPGMEVRIAGEAGVGEIEVRGPSLLEAYVGRDLRLADGGWLATGDVGAVDDGHLHVLGRRDDMFVVGGINLFAADLEATAAGHPAVRPGNCVAVPTVDGRYAIVTELRAGEHDPAAVAADLRAFVGRRARRSPAAVVVLRRGTLPKTPSGKLQRHRVAAALGAGELDALARFDVTRRDG